MMLFWVLATAYAVLGLAFWSFIRTAGKASKKEYVDTRPSSFGATAFGDLGPSTLP